MWLPAATFLAGAVIGGVVIGVGSSGGSGSESDTPTASTSASGASAGPGDTTVVIPEACSLASDSLEKAVGLLRDGVGYVRDFQPKELREVLDELETTDEELRQLASDCSAVEVSSPAAE